MIQARLRLGEGYGPVPPHAVGDHVDLGKAAIAVDACTLLTLHISQGHALFTPLLDALWMVGTCRGREGEREKERKRGMWSLRWMEEEVTTVNIPCPCRLENHY
jgi:hypothetical protein